MENEPRPGVAPMFDEKAKKSRIKCDLSNNVMVDFRLLCLLNLPGEIGQAYGKAKVFDRSGGQRVHPIAGELRHSGYLGARNRFLLK